MGPPWKLTDTGRVCELSSRVLGGSITDLFESSFDKVFPLISDFVDGAHGLNDACGRAGEGEFTVFHFALVQGKGSVAEDDKTAIGEFAGIVFVEIKDDFFFGEFVIADFHIDFGMLNPGT